MVQDKLGLVPQLFGRLFFDHTLIISTRIAFHTQLYPSVALIFGIQGIITIVCPVLPSATAILIPISDTMYEWNCMLVCNYGKRL